MRLVGGSFFEPVPPGGDAYVLKHIIHDWDDDKSIRILRNVRAAMKPNAKLLLIEAVVPVDDREHLAKLLTLEMLVALTGRERTEAEYAELLRRADFRHTKTIGLVGPGSIIVVEAA
jgi:O-methyltransferase domain